MIIRILADDFTGSGDVGIQLKKYGLKVKIHTDSNLKIDNCNDVVVTNTNTRNMEPNLSRDIIKNTVKILNISGYDKLYKKIDSTLRGNIKEEVLELREHIAHNEKICIIVGFPRMGRKIINGIHYINDTILTETEFSRDIHKPVRSANLMDYFKEGRLVKLEEIRGALNETLLEIDEDIIIFDSETENDLNIIAKSLTSIGYDKHIVGSAGIMNYLPKYWKFCKNKVLMVSASCSEKNLNQIDEFKKNNDDNVYTYRLDYTISVNENIKNIENNYNNRDIFITSLDKKDDILEKNPNIVGEYINTVSEYIIKKYNIKNIFLTGGETAIGVLNRLNVYKLNVVDEIDTGVVIYEDFEKKYRVITKPGSFGCNKVYKKAYEKLKNVETIS